MVNHPNRPGRPTPPSSAEPLVERVRRRLARAGTEYDRRAAATRPGSRRRRSESYPHPPGSQLDPGERRERACLRAVFLELGTAHRAYRAQTGNSVTADLRLATTAFKQKPSLSSLVPVAAFLEELGLLAW